MEHDEDRQQNKVYNIMKYLNKQAKD